MKKGVPSDRYMMPILFGTELALLGFAFGFAVVTILRSVI